MRALQDLPNLATENLRVRLLEPSEAGKMMLFRQENREHLGPWEPRRRAEFFTESYWRVLLLQHQRDFQQGLSVALTILDETDSEVLGVCNFTNIVRGTFQSCHLGYALSARYQGQGLMAEALKPACRYIFETLMLHRIMANYLPRNERSGRLLSKLGFEVEGEAKQYLLIDGHWEDHILTSLINPRDVNLPR
ncbi:MAG: ribosomal-protein-alanine N-acetyltransferase [Patiriisocius sp.]|jgi:ribosomal-protein-alanine N-acetyltransferase